MDANLLHISYEGGILEDPAFEPEESMWRMTVSPEKAPAKAQVIELTYRAGDVVAVDGRKMSPATALTALNEIGGRHGVGRLDLVENRYVGMSVYSCVSPATAAFRLSREAPIGRSVAGSPTAAR